MHACMHVCVYNIFGMIHIGGAGDDRGLGTGQFGASKIWPMMEQPNVGQGLCARAFLLPTTSCMISSQYTDMYTLGWGTKPESV